MYTQLVIVMTTANLDENTLSENSDALCIAARDGQLDEVRRLIPISDPSVYDYQPLIWAVYYGYTDILLELIPVSRIDRKGVLHELLDQAVVNEDAKSLEVLLPYYAATLPDDVDTTQIFKSAVTSGSVDCLSLLLPFCDPKHSNSWALKWALLCKHIDVIEFLLPLSDTDGIDATGLLREVVTEQRGPSKSREVAVLLPISNPKNNNSEALKIAAEKGDVETLKLLIPVSDPKANNSQALLAAVESNSVDCVRCLIPVSDVDAMGSRALVKALNMNVVHRYHNSPFDNQIELMLLDASDLPLVWSQLQTPVNQVGSYTSHYGESEEQRKERLEKDEQEKIRAYPDLYHAIVSREQQKLLEQIALEAHEQKSLAVEQWRDNGDEHSVEIENIDQPKQRKM